MRAAFLLVVAACVPPAEKQLGPDVGCADDPPPTAAPERITITGRVVTIPGNPIANATVTGVSSGLEVGATTTDAGGNFSYEHETGRTARLEFARASADGFVSVASYPGRLIDRDTEIELRMPTMGDAVGFAEASGVVPDPTKGVVLLQVTDCNETPVAGGTVTAPPGSSVIYFNATGPDPAATSTDVSGIAMVANIDPGEVDLVGSAAGVSVGPSKVEVELGIFVLTLLRP